MTADEALGGTVTEGESSRCAPRAIVVQWSIPNEQETSTHQGVAAATIAS